MCGCINVQSARSLSRVRLRQGIREGEEPVLLLECHKLLFPKGQGRVRKRGRIWKADLLETRVETPKGHYVLVMLMNFNFVYMFVLFIVNVLGNFQLF